VCNPLSEPKLDEMIRLLDLPRGARVLDIACGKGELLVRLAERHATRRVGVDLSPYCIADLRALAAARAPGAELELLMMDGVDYRRAPESFSLACCLGASWTFGGHEATLRALAAFVRPGAGRCSSASRSGAWTPNPRTSKGTGWDARNSGPTLETFRSASLWAWCRSTRSRAARTTSTGTSRSSGAADRCAREHPDDPDVPELLERVARGRHEYLTWGRVTLGWSLYLFRR